MQRLLIYLGALIVIIILAVASFRLFSGPEDTWLCQNGVWIKHGAPSNPPSGVCLKQPAANGEQTATTTATSSPTADNIAAEIKIDAPTSNQVISSPLEISGQALGSWYFEASFPIKLIDENGQTLATGQAAAQSDWMTSDFVPFKAELNFANPTSSIGMLVFSNDNPSGLPEKEKQYGIPVSFNGVQQIPVKVYLNNSGLSDNSTDCSLVFPVQRLITKTTATARAALEQLLRGATDAEKNQGYSSSINSGVKINSLTITSGTAKVDFDPQMDYQMGGSCRVTAIRAQITQTLEQFSTIKNVIISVNGSVDEALQP